MKKQRNQEKNLLNEHTIKKKTCRFDHLIRQGANVFHGLHMYEWTD